MKKMLTLASLLAIILFLSVPQITQAASDTLVVYAKGKTLDQVIKSDTTATGMQAHKVYKLVSTDTTYLFSGTITVKSDFAVIGKLALNGRPPCIQPDVLSDNSIPANLFIMTGTGTKGVFKNLYLLGLAYNGSVNEAAIALQVLADSIKVTIDNVIFEEWRTFAIGYNGNWDSFFITNSKFRNMVSGAAQWYLGEAIRNTWPGTAYTDTIVMKYNTFFCVNAYSCGSVTKYYQRYLDFSHNNVIWSFKNPFFIFNITDAKINDNIFYGAWAGGISKAEYPWWDQLWSPEVGSIIDLDALDSAKAVFYAPGSTPDANKIYTKAEQKRKIEVKNNVNYWPAALTNFWKTWNDTAHVDSIYTPTWMNARTKKMFTDKTTWPGLTESGNITATDPGFGPSINAVMTDKDGNNVGLLKYFEVIRKGTVTTELWGYKNTKPGTGFWVPPWPLPEAGDMAYSNAALKTGSTDGKPIGDPYWFTGPTGVKDKNPSAVSTFALNEAYPNPFNPSTTISFSLAQPGKVSLKVYNLVGQLLMTVIDSEVKPAGEFSTKVNMNNMPSGIYFYTLSQNGQSITKKMMLLK